MTNCAWGSQHFEVARNGGSLTGIAAGASAAAATNLLSSNANFEDHIVDTFNKEQLVRSFQQLEKRFNTTRFEEYEAGMAPCVSFGKHPIGAASVHMGQCPHVVVVAHTVGPNLSSVPEPKVENCLRALDAIYARMVAYAEDHDIKVIRVLPVSSGIYAGTHGSVILERFVRFWKNAASTHPEMQIKLCLFDRAQYVASLKM